MTEPMMKLERDKDDDDRPHRLVRPGGGFYWMTGDEADDFEARYWTGDLHAPWAEGKGTDADPLPVGVLAAPDGTLLAKGRDVPDGWERSGLTGGSAGWRTERADEAYGDRWYEVRPPALKPVLIPWWKAVGRTLPDGGVVNEARQSQEHPYGAVWASVRWYNADADGMVAVLPEAGR